MVPDSKKVHTSETNHSSVSTYHFDRSRLTNISTDQWGLISRFFQGKRVGSQISLDELVAHCRISRGAGLAFLVALHGDEVLELRLTIYHRCRAKVVDFLEWGKGFPTYPWTCPSCQEVLRGQSHTVVEGLRYGIVGRVNKLLAP